MSLTGRCLRCRNAARDKRRIGRAAETSLACPPGTAARNREKSSRGAPEHGGKYTRVRRGPTRIAETWAVITASAVGRTVTHINARGSKARPERRSSRPRSCYLGSYRKRERERDARRGGEVEEEVPRELAEFIPAISAREQRRDVLTRADFSERNGGNTTARLRRAERLAGPRDEKEEMDR